MLNDFLRSYDVFQEHGVENPLLETLRLSDLLSGGALRRVGLSLLQQEKIDLSYLAQKRKEGMPLEYIIGRATFMGLVLFCSPDTLIPREETELLVKVALDSIEERQKLKDVQCIIDMGTGCGSIAVALAMNSDNTRILASDVSPAAVRVAQKNVNEFNLQERVSLFCGDLFAPFYGSGYEKKIDLVVCNPPYIPTGSLRKLAPGIIDYEPRIALDAGTYGIDFYRRLIADSLSLLKPEGILVFEIGEEQEKLVTRLLNRNGGYKDVRYFKDDAQIIRVISAVKQLEN